MFDFDTPINRHGTHNEKWGRYNPDIIPAWVADMDFKAPPSVIRALKQRVEHGIFGYTYVDESLTQSAINFMKRHYDWQVKPDWFTWVSGVVPSMNIACKMIEPDQRVLTTSPIYPHFFKAPKMTGREVGIVKLTCKDNRWTLDFDAIENAITPQTELFMLCNPYNPGGTLFTCKELERLGEIAKKHDLLIVSDEIHADLILNPEAKHIPIASLNDDLANRTITLMAPSKTFNIAGLNCSYAIIPNSSLKRRFENAMGKLNGGVNLLGLAAAKAAYEGGDEWLKALREYLAQNLSLVQEFVKSHPPLKLCDQDATFLAWIDCSGLDTDPYELFLKHGVALSDGKDFLGEGFVRLNFGCPKSILSEILKRMEVALSSLK